jgi:hypothetical protein
VTVSEKSESEYYFSKELVKVGKAMDCISPAQALDFKDADKFKDHCVQSNFFKSLVDMVEGKKDAERSL